MIADDDKAVLAGEFVLGLLAPEERAWVERARLADRDLDQAISAWEMELQPLDELLEPALPDPQLWSRIEASLWPAGLRGGRRGLVDRVEAWIWSNAGFWRATGALAMVAALLLAVTTYLRPAARIPVPIAVSLLAASANQQPGIVVEVFDDGSLRALPLVRPDLPSGRGLELWTLRDPAEGPISLGVVPVKGQAWQPRPTLLPVAQDQLFEISLEPSTGSPTGKPTGPVLYIGRAKPGP